MTILLLIVVVVAAIIIIIILIYSTFLAVAVPRLPRTQFALGTEQVCSSTQESPLTLHTVC